MSEIYVGSTQRVYFDVYGSEATVVTARLTDDEGLDVALTVTPEAADPDTPERSRYSAYIGLQHTQMERELIVTWTYEIEGEEGTAVHYYPIVTPYVSLQDMREIYPDLASRTDEELIALEQRVRLVINSYTGQNFGFGRKRVEVESENGVTLHLPARVISIEEFEANGLSYPSSSFRIGLSSFSIEWLPISNPNKWAAADPIRMHDLVPRFRRDTRFFVTGIFGWRRVPTEVRQAAIILIGDYSCDESVWRDKYIDNMRASDWRLEFAPGAFSGTGNVQADQLLAPFQVSNMVVI